MSKVGRGKEIAFYPSLVCCVGQRRIRSSTRTLKIVSASIASRMPKWQVQHDGQVNVHTERRASRKGANSESWRECNVRGYRIECG